MKGFPRAGARGNRSGGQTDVAKYHEWLKDDGLLRLQSFARDGLSDEQIAEKVGISRSTLSDWKKRFPDISDAIEKGKAPVDTEVENALLKRALGFFYDEETRELRKKPDSDVYEMELVKTVTKYIYPDVTAQKFWLMNRKPDIWRMREAVSPADANEGAGVIEIIDTPDGRRGITDGEGK